MRTCRVSSRNFCLGGKLTGIMQCYITGNEAMLRNRLRDETYEAMRISIEGPSTLMGQKDLDTIIDFLK